MASECVDEPRMFGDKLGMDVRVLGPPELCKPTVSFTVSGSASLTLSVTDMAAQLACCNRDAQGLGTK